MRTRTLGAQARGAAIGFAAALVLATAGGSTYVTPTGGSLPLQGDGFASGDGGSPDAYRTGTGSQWNVLNWGPGVLAAVPASFGKDTVAASGRTVKQIFVSSQANPDVGTAASVVNMSVSDDSGLTFLNTRQNFPTTALNMVRLPDGSILGIDFIPQWTSDQHTQIDLIVHTSKDGGRWSTIKAPVTMPPDMPLGPVSNGLRVHRGPMVLRDGTLIVPAYTVLAGSSRQISIVLQSTDRGRSWSFRSAIPGGASPGTNEVGWSHTSDGRLIAVLRTTDNPARLVQSFSADEGRSWTAPVPLLGPDGAQVTGIYPDLVLQPNGSLLLSTGRPDVRVLVSFDGTGRTWNTQSTVFANYPSTGNNGRYDGTSGNTTIENVGANRSVVFFDQCHVWGCGAYNEQMGISAEYVSAVTPGTGRIDIMSKLLDGTATLNGSFAKHDKAFPEQRPLGAFDGSAAARAATVLNSSMVLTLDRSYELNRIGLMLGNGQARSATVSLSADGVHWSSPVVTATGRRDWAMRYTDFPAQPARYIKVSGPPGTTVTEFEAYAADVDTFENETPFAVPRGWTDAQHAWVTDVPPNVAYAEFGGYHSATSLRLWDKWTDDNARITRPFPAAGQVTASMQWGFSDQRTRFTVATGGFKLAIAGGAIQVYDGSKWTVVGTLGTAVPTRTYVPLSLSANAESATLTVNGQSFTTTVHASGGHSFDGITFTTGDPSEYGGAYYLDDVSVSS